MNVFAIILIVTLAGFITWLTIDTVVLCVKKSKQRKKEKEIKQSNQE